MHVKDLVLHSQEDVLLVLWGHYAGLAVSEDLGCRRCSHLPDLQLPLLVSSPEVCLFYLSRESAENPLLCSEDLNSGTHEL
jgi:hypothetical protein